MSEIITLVKSAKESAAYVAMSAGAGMTQASFDFVQFIGAIIGAAGIVVAILRWIEARKAVAQTTRANNLKEEKWRYQRAKNANDKETEINSKTKYNSEN